MQNFSVFKFFKWLITEVNTEGWKLFYYGACLGGIIAVLFAFPFRYRVIPINSPHMAPIWLKFDRLTGTAWKSIGFGSEWVLVTNHVETVFVPPPLNSENKSKTFTFEDAQASTNIPDWAR